MSGRVGHAGQLRRRREHGSGGHTARSRRGQWSELELRLLLRLGRLGRSARRAESRNVLWVRCSGTLLWLRLLLWLRRERRQSLLRFLALSGLCSGCVRVSHAMVLDAGEDLLGCFSRARSVLALALAMRGRTRRTGARTTARSLVRTR